MSGRRWRWSTPTSAGAWWPTRREAGDDAVRLGLASRDDDGTLFLDVLTSIDMEETPVEGMTRPGE